MGEVISLARHKAQRSNLRPIGDLRITGDALSALFSVMPAASDAGPLSHTRRMLLLVMLQAQPGAASSAELCLAVRLNPAALAEHLVALRGRGLVMLGSLRLSPCGEALARSLQATPLDPGVVG